MATAYNPNWTPSPQQLQQQQQTDAYNAATFDQNGNPYNPQAFQQQLYAQRAAAPKPTGPQQFIPASSGQMPAYLQGTQTGAGLFGQPQNGLQSSIPSAPQMGLQSSIPNMYSGQQNLTKNAQGQVQGWIGPNQYAPGDGTVKYVGTGQAAPQNSFNSSNTNMNPNVSTFPGGTPGATPASGAGVLSSIPPAGTSGTAAGGWMSPEQLRAQTNSLQDHQIGDTGSGTGAAGTGVGGTQKKDGAGAVPVGAVPTQNQVPNVTPGQYSGSPVNYAPIGNVSGGGTYAPPGQQPGQSDNGALQMQQQSPQSAIADYQNTPGYQLLMANQQNQFQQSPGYQYAVNQALGQVQNNASARGLLESGSVMREMTDRAQGMASQGYNDWWNKQNSSFNDYQNRLAGLAGGNVGGDQAFNLGQNLGQNTYQTGGDVGSLFGNQGTSGLGAISGTGAAQAGNIGNAGTQQGQIAGANASTQLAGATYNRGLF